MGNDESTTATQPRLPRRIAQGNSDSGLQAYAQITRDYYLARRCAPGDYRGLGSMYHHIVATHNSLMRNHGAGEVAAVLRRSARAARAQGC